MFSRSTRRPMTPDVPSIWSIVSAGTRRRRREKRPDFTERASGTSGAVPYIGHSTFPTRRPWRSATMYPVVRRRSMARALTLPTVFPPCDGIPNPLVKLSLIRVSAVGSFEISGASVIGVRTLRPGLAVRATRRRRALGLLKESDQVLDGPDVIRDACGHGWRPLVKRLMYAAEVVVGEVERDRCGQVFDLLR